MEKYSLNFNLNIYFGNGCPLLGSLLNIILNAWVRHFNIRKKKYHLESSEGM